MMELVFAAVISGVLLASAVFVVSGRNLVHCVLMLAVLLFSTAVLFVLLQAPFLAGIQVMLYAGGVVTLMLFAIMLTRRGSGVAIMNETLPGRRLPGAAISIGLCATLCYAIHGTPDFATASDRPLTTYDLGIALFTKHALAFEVLGALLLAATIGAIVLARKRDHGAPEPSGQLGFGSRIRGESVS
jgi:NADH-quinone oxidoreductase subunit J